MKNFYLLVWCLSLSLSGLSLGNDQVGDIDKNELQLECISKKNPNNKFTLTSHEVKNREVFKVDFTGENIFLERTFSGIEVLSKTSNKLVLKKFQSLLGYCRESWSFNLDKHSLSAKVKIRLSSCPIGDIDNDLSSSGKKEMIKETFSCSEKQ
jgi:hypothetical protein